MSFQDELLAENEKVVLKIDDLLKWIVPDAFWESGTPAARIKMEASDGEEEEKMLQMFAANNSPLHLDDVRKEKKLCGMQYSCLLCSLKLCCFVHLFLKLII